jgi:hypothetical protein
MTLPYQEVFLTNNRQFRIEAKKKDDHVTIQVFEIISGISMSTPQVTGEVITSSKEKLNDVDHENVELEIEKVKRDLLLLASSASIGL